MPVGELLTLAGQVVGSMGVGDGTGEHGAGAGVIPLTVEHVGPDGSRETVPMSL